jgi:hypothetical protein
MLSVLASFFTVGQAQTTTTPEETTTTDVGLPDIPTLPPYSFCQNLLNSDWYDYYTAYQCSDNPECACANTVGNVVCTKQASCSCAKPCNPKIGCANEDETCVYDPRCQNEGRCYSSTLFSERTCPPLRKIAAEDTFGSILRKKHGKIRKQA